MEGWGRTGADLESEEPSNPSLADSEHWLGLYTRLIEFTRGMLEQTRAVEATMPAPARRHLESTNVRILVEELEVFERRRQVWAERVRELSDERREA
jgi:hypothetical protein